MIQEVEELAKIDRLVATVSSHGIVGILVANKQGVADPF
jgi:hypothetical protein